MNIRTYLGAFLLVTMACGASLGGCDNRQQRASEAFGRYEAANAAGDLEMARRALSEVVAVDDDVASYWIELGRINLQLADFAAAYGAFTRADELDRANAMTLATLTQLALRSGNLNRAQEHARQLELVAPSDPAIRLTYGYIALRRGDTEGASEQAGTILAAAPYDPSAKVLQSRILLQSDQPDAAMSLLQEQVRLQPSDPLALRALLAIYELRERWPEAAAAARDLRTLQPEDRDLALRVVENALRAGQVALALADFQQAMVKASPREIDRLFAAWFATGHQQEAVASAVVAGRAAQGEQRVAYARFLTGAGQPEPAMALLRELAKIPIRPSNLSANAIYGAALTQTGATKAAMERLDGVIAVDAANSDALRARSQLRSRQGQHKAAIEDARRLVAADRSSAQARLTLARAYATSNQGEDARRTLWDAFHDIPGERSIYEALKVVVKRAQGSAGSARLTEEFNDQRNVKLIRSFA